jgi:hypothetical protein
MGSIGEDDVPSSCSNPAYKSACAFTKIFIRDCLDVMSKYREGLQDWKTVVRGTEDVGDGGSGSPKIE